MNTLRGVFPEPAPMPRRNFIKENMIHIKRMQGLVDNPSQRSAPSAKRNTLHSTGEANSPTHRTMKLIHTTRKQLQNFARLSLAEKPKMISASSSKDMPSKKHAKYKLRKSEKCNMVGSRNVKETVDKHRFKEIGVQTDETDSANLMHEKQLKPAQHPPGTVAQESHQRRNSLGKTLPSNKNTTDIRSPKLTGDGDKSKRNYDFPAESSHHTETTDRKHDFVKENAQVVKHVPKPSVTQDPTLAPATYQKGVVPKYIQERKEELQKKTQGTEGDEQCPEGYVILPEIERKETLRMLKQSYAELVTDLNMLPVRSDTLRMRTRKQEIDNKLKKLEEGIKVFSTPKVFVKTDA